MTTLTNQQKDQLIQELAESLTILLKEARANSFNLTGNINDTPAEAKAHELLHKVKSI